MEFLRRYHVEDGLHRHVSITHSEMYFLINIFFFFINKEARKFIKSQRGLKRECLLSPYLFILYAKSLSSLLHLAEHKAAFPGVQFGKNDPAISHLFFTDDSLIISGATPSECKTLKTILDVYAQASGQIINYDKSSIFFSTNTPLETRDEIKQIFNLEAVSHHENYLGLLSMIGKSKYSFLIFWREEFWTN